MPIAPLPGIGAMIRMLGARRASARSSERLVILLILTPGAGSSSYMVMTGPGFTSITSSLDAEIGELLLQGTGIGDQVFPLDPSIFPLQSIEQGQGRQLEFYAQAAAELKMGLLRLLQLLLESLLSRLYNERWRWQTLYPVRLRLRLPASF